LFNMAGKYIASFRPSQRVWAPSTKEGFVYLHEQNHEGTSSRVVQKLLDFC
jgi:hypothetical protein